MNGQRKRKTNIHLNIQNKILPCAPTSIIFLLVTYLFPPTFAFHKSLLSSHLLKVFHADIVVVDIALLSWARVAGVWEIEVVKTLGRRSRRSLYSVPFPTPLGPLMIMGRKSVGADGAR